MNLIIAPNMCLVVGIHRCVRLLKTIRRYYSYCRLEKLSGGYHVLVW